MTTQKPTKPREFWIDAFSGTDYFETFISTNDPQTLTDSNDFMNIGKSKYLVHVIEMSAYQALEAKLEVAKDALKISALYYSNYPKHGYGCGCESETSFIEPECGLKQEVENALAKLEGEG